MQATSPTGCSLTWVLPFRGLVGLRRLCSSAPACSVLFNSLRPPLHSSSYRAWLFPSSKSPNRNGPKQSISQAAFFFFFQITMSEWGRSVVQDWKKQKKEAYKAGGEGGGRTFQFFSSWKHSGGTSLVDQWLILHTPNSGDTGLVPVQGTRSHMPQLRVRMCS